MHFRQTIAGTREITGIGLHSGRKINMRLLPAGPETGIVFVRTDADSACLKAALANAGPCLYATKLQRGDLTISTIEHLMAALYSLQVDDLRIELDGPEVPILDGSSKPFVESILDAELVQHDVVREYLNITRPVVIQQDDKMISIHPCREYRVTYAIDFNHPLLGYQELTASLWRAEEFRHKLAPARTFTFEKDVEELQRMGLARGGSLDNAVVIGERGLLNRSLRFADEFVRHKMLDLTGDLSLLGYPVRGHVVAYRAGHDLHGRLVRRIWELDDSWYLAPWKEEPQKAPLIGELPRS